MLRRLIGDKRGNVLMMTVGALPVLVGMTGLGVDTVQWSLWKRQLQRAADSGALAGAYAYAQSANVDSTVAHDLTTNADRSLSAAPVVSVDPATKKVTVSLQASQQLPFSSMFLDSTPVIGAVGVAQVLSLGEFCVLSLENGTATGITLQGNATVDLGCAMATNSRATDAVNLGGSSTANVTYVSAVGGIDANAGYAATVKLNPYSLPQTDPFASLPEPTAADLSNCAPKRTVNPTATATISPGCYRGLDVRGTVTLSPGIYYIDGSAFSAGSQAVINGTGVTIILTSSTIDTNPGSVATLDINGGAQLNLVATEAGPYAGVLFYQDRRASLGGTNKMNGNASTSYQGAVYFPKQDLQFNGTAGMTTQCMHMVARRLSFSGNSTISNVCPANSGVQVIPGIVVRLVA